eukprot:449008_1
MTHNQFCKQNAKHNKVLSNIINNPDSIKYKSIDVQALLDRFKDKKCIEILQKAGFKKSIEERGLRLKFDNDQYSELEYVYSQLMFIHIFNENSFVSYNPHMLDAFNSKYLLKPTRLHVIIFSDMVVACEQCLAI